MGLFSFGAAVAIGVLGTKVYERVKEKNPDTKPDVNTYINEAKEVAGELVNKGLEKAPDVIDKAGEVVNQAKEKVEQYMENKK